MSHIWSVEPDLLHTCASANWLDTVSSIVSAALPPSVSKSPTSSVQNMPPKYQKQPQPVAKTCLANIRQHCKYVQVKYVKVKGGQIFYTGREANLQWHIRWNNSRWHICANNLKHWHIFNEACPPHTAGNRVHRDLHPLEYSTFHRIFGSCLHC